MNSRKDFWAATENRVMEVLKPLNCPQSVVETMTGTIYYFPEKEEEIMEKAKACKTPKEVVKAMQVYPQD